MYNNNIDFDIDNDNIIDTNNDIHNHTKFI